MWRRAGVADHQLRASSDRLILVRNLHSFEDTRQRHAARAARGIEVRIARGACIDEPYWAGLAARDRYLLTIRAVAETRGARPILSHWSAAAIHGLPIIGPWPHRVHVTQDAAIRMRSRGMVVRHSLPLAGRDVVEIDGLLVTSVARTAIDLAVVSPGVSAVTSMDAALHVDRFQRRPPLVTLDELREAWDARLPFRGHSRVRDVIDFGVTNSDSPIESASRWNMRIVGCPSPILQQSQFDYRGFIADTDFSGLNTAPWARPMATSNISTRPSVVVDPPTRSYPMRRFARIAWGPAESDRSEALACRAQPRTPPPHAGHGGPPDGHPSWRTVIVPRGPVWSASTRNIADVREQFERSALLEAGSTADSRNASARNPLAAANGMHRLET